MPGVFGSKVLDGVFGSNTLEGVLASRLGDLPGVFGSLAGVFAGVFAVTVNCSGLTLWEGVGPILSQGYSL